MDDERVHPETVTAWRAWLFRHHATSSGVWLVTWKRHTGRPAIGYEDSVVEALAYGWIDSKANSIDDERSMIWFCPRRPKSGWSRPNKERIARLEAEGRMQPAGRAAIEIAKANGAWTLLDSVENLEVPDDLAAAFAERPGSRQHWESFPRSVKRAMLEWIVHAKREQTRAKRVLATAEKAALGERAY